MYICVFVCANVILCRYLLDPLALLDFMVSLMPTSLKEGVRSDRQVFRPRLVGESSALPLTQSDCSYTVIDSCTLSWLRRER